MNSQPTEKQVELLRLAAKSFLKLFREQSHLMGDFGCSAEACNLYELCFHGLGYVDNNPQVPLEEIINYVEKQLEKNIF